MATFRNGCGCTIRGISSAKEINKERMGDGWQIVDPQELIDSVEYTESEQAELNLSKVARRQK